MAKDNAASGSAKAVQTRKRPGVGKRSPPQSKKTVPEQQAATQEFASEEMETDLHPGKNPADLDGTQDFDESKQPLKKPTGKTPFHEQATQEMSDDEEILPGKPAPKQGAAKPGPKSNVLGDFRLIKKLGAGGMGTVYKAHQISLDREVAIKVLPKHLAANETLVQRFLREARIMARLDHPNILRCFGVGQLSGFHYLSMEFVDGGSLQDHLAKLGKLEIGDAVYILLACARALEDAHGKKLIHRDIKPENILLTKSGQVKVADLGLAKALDEDLSLTKSGTGAGTPLYMPPEQARNVKYVDHRSDIYSLGCMSYRMLAGEVPFQGETMVEVVAAKEAGKFTPVRQHNDEVPTQLDLIIDKMIAAKPEHRFQSCAEIIKELESLGLANDRLSFLAGAVEETDEPVVTATKSDKTAAPEKTEVESSFAPERQADDEPGQAAANEWYVKLEAPSGKMLLRKVTTEQIRGLIRNGAVANDTPAGKTHRGPFKPLATFKVFQGMLLGKSVKAKADKKTKKLRGLYEQLERDERRWRWKKWWRNITARIGGTIGFLIVMLVLILLVAAGYFLFRDQVLDMARRMGVM